MDISIYYEHNLLGAESRNNFTMLEKPDRKKLTQQRTSTTI